MQRSQRIEMRPIGHVVSGRYEPIDDHWDGIDSRIELDPDQFSPDATAGLEAFSHIEVVFRFDRVSEEAVLKGAAHPRGRTDWPKVGIFAQRGKARPNRIGVTTCRLIECDGLSLKVSGLDAIDGTPVLDIKPVLSGFFPRGPFREPNWAKEIMKYYW